MPELPDVTVYIEALERRVLGHTLERIDIISPFVLRTFDPPISFAFSRTVKGIRRLGKRIVFDLDGYFLVIHLMIAGRFQWFDAPPKPNRKLWLASLKFDSGWLAFTEASPKKRASMHLVRGAEALKEFDRGGLEVMDASPDEFTQRLRSENHTVKRALADPRLFSGIGNAYSDEILHRAKMSPMALTSRLSDEQAATLFEATRATLREWTERLRKETGEGFPKKVTAFREEMAVHGKFGKPCPVCGTPVQRIRYADNETNYCPRCQTEGKLLKDRALSRLLHDDWPRSIDEL
jgi:formamidopyrimidine-DNA glycosylase